MWRTLQLAALYVGKCAAMLLRHPVYMYISLHLYAVKNRNQKG